MKTLDKLTDLSMYIKNEFAKQKIGESFITISTIEEAETAAATVSQGNICNLIFKNSILRSRFFSILEVSRPDITIVNCNTNYRVFDKQVFEAGGQVIYNNFNRCDDNDIVKYILNNKSTIIC
jgi:hypothetical protein